MKARSDDARAVPFLLAGVVVLGFLGYRLVGTIGQLATTAAWTWWAAYVVGALLVGVAVVLVARRIRPSRPAEGSHPALVPVLALAAAVSLVALGTAGTSFSEAVGCARGDGVVVSASLTSVEVRRSQDDLDTGHYTVDGERHELKVRDASRRDRMVGPDHYRVPWVGSDFACGTSRSGDAPYVLGYLALGLVAGTVGAGATGEVVRRLRRR